MFNDVVVTLVQLIEGSESSASVSIFIVILEAPVHQKLHALFVFWEK